jgi:serine/threonine-protein kinase
VRALPRRFGRYTLVDAVGRGGMAEIFLARAETQLGGSRLCVVKRILPEHAAKHDFAAMLIHEAKLAARLNHGNVVQVFDLGREEGELFIAMEYVDGYDLNGLLRLCHRRSVPLPLPFALHIVASVLRGLDHAHTRCGAGGESLGIVHRDVTPSNILLSLDGDVKVCDFGIAHAHSELDHLSEAMASAIQGKAGYMSPEQADGRPLDARSDVYQVGVVLWELLAGRKLRRRVEGGPSLLEQALAGTLPPLPERGIPEETALHDIVHRALQFDRRARFSSAAAMLAEVESYAARHRQLASALRFGEWIRTSFPVLDRLAPSTPPPPPPPATRPMPPEGRAMAADEHEAGAVQRRTPSAAAIGAFGLGGVVLVALLVWGLLLR